MSHLLKPSIVALAALNLIDMGITAFLLATFGAAAEANLLMRTIWDASPILFVTSKVLLSAFFVYLSMRVDWSRKWMAYAIVPTAGVYVAVVGWSVFILVNAM